jgi:hypothetical protein
MFLTFSLSIMRNQTKTLYLVSTLGVLDPGEDFRGVEVLVGQMVEFG